MCKIGYLGPAGTFSEQAALYFAQSCPGELIAYSDVPELILAVQSGALHYAVVPIENVLEGTVNVTVDILAHDTNLVIVGEQVLPIQTVRRNTLYLCCGIHSQAPSWFFILIPA
jgi:prephenate dehydratase